MANPVTVSDCGKGVNKDLLSSELAPGMWSDSLNVRFRNGFVGKRKGVREAYTTPSQVPYWLEMFYTSTTRFIVRATTNKVHVDDGSTATEITPATPPTGARDNRWTGGDFNGVLIMNNGVDAPYSWNGNTANDLIALANWPAGYLADTIRPFKEYLFAGAVTKASVKYPQLLIWSNAAEAGAVPTAWTAATTNDAGDDPFSEVGGIVDMMRLGDLMIIYGENGRVAAQYVGGNDVFRFTRLPGNDGLISRGCVASTPKGHVFLSSGDVLLHSGGETVSIADGSVREWIFNTMDTTNVERAFVVANPQESEVWIVFPSAGETECNYIAAWNWKENTWAILSSPSLTCGAVGLLSSNLTSASWASQTNTWAAASNVWSQDEFSSNEKRLVVGNATPKLGIANIGTQDFGATITTYVERVGIELIDGDRLASFSRLRPRMEAVAGTQVTVKLSTTMSPNDTPVYAASSTFTQGTSIWANQITSAGRYGAVRIEGLDDQPFEIRSYQYELTGSRAKF